MRFLPQRQTPSPARSRATMQRRPPPALTAAAVAADRRNAPGLRRLNQPWQGLALARYQDVGECWYPAQFYARTMQRVRFYPALLDEKGDAQEVTSGPLLALWDRVQDPGGGRSELTAAYGQLMFLTGDGYLIDTVADGEEAWEFLSPLELRVLPESGARVTYKRLRAPGLTPEELVEAPDDAFEPLGNEARVYRLYRRDPGFSAWSDSPVRAVLELYQLLRMLTLAAAAEAQSRAANRGLLYVPDELSFTSPDGQAGEEDIQEDTLYQDLIEGLMRAISDPGDAGAMAPFLMRGPGVVQTGLGTALPMGDLIKWLPLGPADSYRAVDAWDKVVARIGNGLDLPGSIVTGEARNHWGDWAVDEQSFRLHVAPICDKFGSDLVSAYLRPAAKADGLTEWKHVTIGYDPAEAVNHPDQTTTIKDAHDRLVVSDAYYREGIGANDEAAPDEAELERRTLVKINVDPYAEAEQEGETPPAEGGTGADTTELLPAEPPPNGQPPPAQAASALRAAHIIGAAEAHVHRARALAGARLKNRSQKCQECKDRVRGLVASAIPAALGAEQVRTILEGHGSEADLVKGAGAELAEALGRWGVAPEWRVELGERVEQHSLRTLYELEPPPLPAGFSAVVAKAVAA